MQSQWRNTVRIIEKIRQKDCSLLGRGEVLHFETRQSWHDHVGRRREQKILNEQSRFADEVRVRIFDDQVVGLFGRAGPGRTSLMTAFPVTV